MPQFDAPLENQARRFIALVDEFYDRRVKLILSAAAPVAELYRGEKLRHDFQRTRSRLEEMQTHDYLAPRIAPSRRRGATDAPLTAASTDLGRTSISSGKNTMSSALLQELHARRAARAGLRSR